ncbi:glycoside hydrolase family 3 C-terminal domain-containing protein [Parafrigoribacterium humi]|uniref:glycoside hydrolase family 3 C-terminal domain-containing protein n=1 Tax=Parafrigoribacterium humi TaxID=3144664 RepID=UPI0032EE2226
MRKVRQATGGFAIGENEESTAFPPAVTVASSWNPENARLMGEAIGREARSAGVDVILGPGVNIKRSPLCGRNFEYFSEDPLISGVMGSAFVRGLQSQGVGASVKHFAANSNENYRFVGDSIVDERALREIYLRAFERVVTEAQPETVMCSYNRLNGTFASESRELLTDILRDEWGFTGVVMTDWGATDNRPAAILAGADLDMPGQVPHNRQMILDGVRDGRLSASVLDIAVGRVLDLVARHCTPQGEAANYDLMEHAALSGMIARQGAVLLENNGTLPLSAGDGELLVVGEMFEVMRYQGAGSSLITPPEVISPRVAFDQRAIDYRYVPGYRAFDGATTAEMIDEAVRAARDSQTVLFFGGLTDLEESEGFDRTHMRLGDGQLKLLEALIEAGAAVVLVLFAGTPVELPMADRLAAVLNMNLPGMHGGDATAALLFGEANPSGKLAETWVKKIEDSSPYGDYNRGALARYYESIYVGYRFHDAAKTDLAYPFGFGMSYTSFAYSDLIISVKDGVVTCQTTVTNMGHRDGAEIVQLYVGANSSAVFKPEKELRGFARIEIPAGQARVATISFPLSELSYWDVGAHDWVLENGDYLIQVAASAADIRLVEVLSVQDQADSRSPYSAAVDTSYSTPPRTIPAAFPSLVGHPIADLYDARRLTMNTRLIDARRTLLGRLVSGAIIGSVAKNYRAALKLPESLDRDSRVKNSYFVLRMMPNSSMRSLAMSSGGTFPYDVAKTLELLATGHPVRALKVLAAWRKGTR